MKKIMISAAIFAAMMVSCTTETTEFVNEYENETANVGIFDAEKPLQREPNYDKFVKCAIEIVEMHRQFDYFRAVLPANILQRIDTESYTIDEAVFAIYLWWKNPETWDVLTEWTIFDDFCANMPVEYIDKYGFHW
jgi:hypothetical protein